jgi:hypothetical protein
MGLSGGVHATWTLGSFETTCNCVYDHASEATGFEAGMQAEFPFSPHLGAGVALSWLDLSTTYTATETRSEYVSDLGRFVAVDVERTAAVTLQYMTLRLAAVWYTGVGGLRMFGGPLIGVPCEARIVDRERILTPGYRFVSGREKTHLDDDMKDALSAPRLRFAFDAGAAYAVPLSIQTSFVPWVGVSIPLDDVLENSSGWKLGAVSAGAAFMLRL